ARAFRPALSVRQCPSCAPPGTLLSVARYLYALPTKCNRSLALHSAKEICMRPSVILFTATLTLATGPAHADECRLKPKEVVTRFMNEFYIQKHVRTAFETWVEPGYVQHNPLAATGRDAAVGFLEPFFRDHPDANYSIKRGIGLAAARACQAEGARVAITGRDEATLEQGAAQRGMLAVRSDMGSVADSRTGLARIAGQLGGIDVLHVNAGVGGFAAVHEVTEEFWDSVHGVNLRGAFFAVQAALPHLRDGGSIVITGSIGAVLALPGNVVYAAAKAGLRQVARILAAELLPRRIRVNVV